LKQKTNFEFEFIIGDDDSDDGTREVCIDYANKYPDIIKLYLHKKENKRLVLGKKSGIFQIAYNLIHSNGKYIAICSGDDYWTDSYKLQKQFDFMENNPNYSLCYHSSYVIDEYSNKSSFINHEAIKASSMFYINIKNQLPINFIKVIQEDAFSWFILIFIGHFKFLNNIKPVGINAPKSSLVRSINAKTYQMHSLNLRYQIYNSYKNSKTIAREYSCFKLIVSIKSNLIMGNLNYTSKLLAKVKFINLIRGLLYKLKNKPNYKYI
jgi:glycosyltransferase involved in cell wall biosynthesis